MINIPHIKLSSGDLIPRLGLGTWTIGGTFNKNPNNDDQLQIKSIQDALDQGFSWIRTAQNYAGGHCEELICEAIRGRDRNDLFINSCVNENIATDKDKLIANAKLSLKRLGINYFDLYIIGGVNPNVSIKEIADGLLFLLENKLAKNIGVANYRLEELKFISDYTNQRICYNEMHYNLIIREPELTGILDFCKNNKIILSAYRPLQFGQLCKPGIEILDLIAKKHKKTQSQVALKWLVQKEGVVAIPKVLTHKHIQEDLDIFDWMLSEDEVQNLDKEFPIQMRMSDCIPPQKPLLK